MMIMINGLFFFDPNFFSFSLDTHLQYIHTPLT